MRVLPALVAKLTHTCEAWVVGSAADPATDLSAVRDWDVIVPFAHWSRAAALIAGGPATMNTFGGWKCESEGALVDVWPEELTTFMTIGMVTYAWHPRSGVRIRKDNGGKV